MFFLKDIRTEEQVFWRHENRRTCFFERHKNRRTSFLERHENRRTSFIPQSKNMFSCSSVLLSYPSQAIPMFFCLIPRKQSPCSHVLLSYSSQAISMFFCLITMHIFLIPIKILNCFSLPFQISFIILYINILSLRKIENSIYTFYRNGTSTL